MKMKTIHVGITKKINLGNNESKIHTITIDAEIEEGEDLYDVTNKLKDQINFQLREWESEPIEENKNIKKNNKKIIEKPVIQSKDDLDILEEVVCPKCGELMAKEEGKKYYMCEEHYGSLVQIKSGKVMKRRF
ncbi:MAG: hypothetical protein ACW981_06045 [Candidatus Hodarchaeales archaeon]|jgi:hypothetical protein